MWLSRRAKDLVELVRYSDSGWSNRDRLGLPIFLDHGYASDLLTVRYLNSVMRV